MKVLHVIDHLGFGGAQTIVRGLFESQKKSKDIFLFALKKEEKNTVLVDHKNVYTLNSCKKYSLSPIRVLKNLIEKEKIKIVHCHLFRSQVFGFFLKKRYFPKIKLIFHEHGKILRSGLIYRNFLRLSKTNVDLYLAVSQTTKKKLIKKIGISKKKIKVLYNFTSFKEHNKRNIGWNIQEKKEKLGIRTDEFVIGFVGRLSKIKGCEYLIASLPYLNFKYKVLIAGDGPLMEYLKKLSSSLKIANKVIFLGYISDIEKVYILIDALVVPSLSESFGISIIEAFSMRVPVIASNVPALNEVVQNKQNGLLFKTKNSKDLSKKIKELYLDEGLRTRLVENGLKKVESYSLGKYLEKLNKYYAKIYIKNENV